MSLFIKKKYNFLIFYGDSENFLIKFGISNFNNFIILFFIILFNTLNPAKIINYIRKCFSMKDQVNI